MRKTFYGWYVLLGLCLIYGTANGIVTLSLKRFYPSLMEAFSLSAAQVTQPVSYLYFTAALLTPFVGALLDRHNPKRIILIGTFIIITGLVLFGQIEGLTHFTAVFVVLAVGLSASGLASSMYILTKWFHKHRGKAVGILLVGGSLGGALFNKIVGDCIDLLGWRNTTLVLAALAAILMILPWIFLVKTSPKEMGLFPDGADSEPSTNLIGGVTLIEALKSPTLYIIFLATGILWFCIIGSGQHQDIYLQKELSLDSKLVTNVGSLFFLFGVIGKLLFGFLSDRFNKKAVMSFSIGLLIVGNVFLYLLGAQPGQWSPYWYAVTYGIAYSGVFTMIQIVVADLYYGKSYGKILGIVLTIDTLASVAGIVMLGRMQSAYGTYLPAIQMMAILCTFALIGFLLVRTNFKKKLT